MGGREWPGCVGAKAIIKRSLAGALVFEATLNKSARENSVDVERLVRDTCDIAAGVVGAYNACATS